MKRHEHSTFIDAIGPGILATTFGLTPQRLYMWRVRGVPHIKLVQVAKLAAERGVEPPPGFLDPIRTGEHRQRESVAA